eukprot:TRINITY_DN113105_c0_g1_i1.p1 TRINITY_DN113105_c0_g1~~TRINITY_DN113105_c0_g1_i1.p1  ORF type:complete len:247 (-),score=50.82 TRINITY_DN113105_c0_g1_i1:92-793(-)
MLKPGRKHRSPPLSKTITALVIWCTVCVEHVWHNAVFVQPARKPGKSSLGAETPIWSSAVGRRPAISVVSLLVSGRPAAAAANSLDTVRAARAVISDTLKNYDVEIKGNKGSLKGNVGVTLKGFDTVRRYLGTVGDESPFSPGPGQPGKLEAAYRSLAEESGDPSVLEITEDITSHLIRADTTANSATRGRSRSCKGGDGKSDACIPVFFEEIRTELQASLRGFDALLKAVGA